MTIDALMKHIERSLFEKQHDEQATAMLNDLMQLAKNNDQ